MSVVAGELPGARVLDLFAGSGALGLEALSRGARKAVFVERAPGALKALRANVVALGAEGRADVLRADALRYATELEEVYDVAFADPPYGEGIAAALLQRQHNLSFARVLGVEHSRRDPLPPFPDLQHRRYGDTMLTFLLAPA